MRKLLLATPLLLATLPAAAQQTNWTGPNLIVNGATANGCNIELSEASHFGTAENSIRIGFINNGPTPVRAYAHVLLTGPAGTKVNPEFSIAMASGIGGISNRVGGPFAGSLAGTRLTVNITRCVIR